MTLVDKPLDTTKELYLASNETIVLTNAADPTAKRLVILAKLEYKGPAHTNTYAFFGRHIAPALIQV